MATNYNPSNVSITVGGKPLHIHRGNVDLDEAPSPFFVAPIRPVTAPVFVNGELVLSRRGRCALARMHGTPLIDRTRHPMRFHRPLK